MNNQELTPEEYGVWLFKELLNNEVSRSKTTPELYEQFKLERSTSELSDEIVEAIQAFKPKLSCSDKPLTMFENDDTYESKREFVEDHFNKGYQIHTVKVGNEEYSVGETADAQMIFGFKIDAFKIENGSLYVYGYMPNNSAYECLCLVKHLRKVKPTVYVTADNVEIKDVVEHTVHWVRLSDLAFGSQPFVGKHLYSHTKFKYFSTESAAKEWIRLNKPVASIQQITDAWNACAFIETCRKQFLEALQSQLKD